MKIFLIMGDGLYSLTAWVSSGVVDLLKGVLPRQRDSKT